MRETVASWLSKCPLWNALTKISDINTTQLTGEIPGLENTNDLEVHESDKLDEFCKIRMPSEYRWEGEALSRQ